MTVASFVVAILSALFAGGSAWYARAQTRVAKSAVSHARAAADAATRSADVAEVVEKGRHNGWRIEGKTNEATPLNVYTLRNVGTVDARDVTLAGDYTELRFSDSQGSADIAAGQARLIVVSRYSGNRGGEIHVSWTPALPDAEQLTWTETPPHYRG
jgi:hypothetical protein